jgi:hypothetical protein
MDASVADPSSASAPSAASTFPSGLLLGAASWLDDLAPMLGTVASGWARGGSDAGPPALDGIDVIVDATALDGHGRASALTTDLADAVLATTVRPQRIILLVGDEWLGTSGSLGAAATSAAALAVGRGLALRLVASGTTVNAIAVPPGFPTAKPPSTAPVQHAVGLPELVHTLIYFAAPANDYVTGQVLSLSGGDTTWSNLSA